MYFLNNHSDRAFHDTIRLRTDARQAEYWDAVTGQRYMIPVKHPEKKGQIPVAGVTPFTGISDMFIEYGPLTWG